MKSKLKDSGIKHISIIMDGNGRWAKSRGLNRVKGHEKGAETLRNIVDYAGQIGLDYLSVFAFSTENWKRPKTEVTALMNLLVKFCKKETPNLLKNNCRLLFVGDIDRDGRLDIVINDTYKYGIENISIFLSSKAKKGQAVQKIYTHFGGFGC